MRSIQATMPPQFPLEFDSDTWYAVLGSSAESKIATSYDAPLPGSLHSLVARSANPNIG